MTCFGQRCIAKVDCNNLQMSIEHPGRCAKGLGVRYSLLFEEPFSGAHDEKIAKGIAEFQFDSLVVEEIEVSSEIKPFLFFSSFCRSLFSAPESRSRLS